jgi:uncharacterized membrane protein
MSDAQKMPRSSLKNTTINLIWIFSLVGLIVAAYLSYVKLFHAPIYCTPGLGDCATVNASQWSVLWGIPIAFFGMVSYLAILLLVFLGPKIAFLRPYSKLLIFGIGLFGFLFSVYLTYLEFFIIKTICQWCLLSAVCMTTIFITSIFLLKQDSSTKPQLGGKLHGSH